MFEVKLTKDFSFLVSYCSKLKPCFQSIYKSLVLFKVLILFPTYDS